MFVRVLYNIVTEPTMTERIVDPLKSYIIYARRLARPSGCIAKVVILTKLVFLAIPDTS